MVNVRLQRSLTRIKAGFYCWACAIDMIFCTLHGVICCCRHRGGARNFGIRSPFYRQLDLYFRRGRK
jgi:hypothetical protein